MQWEEFKGGRPYEKRLGGIRSGPVLVWKRAFRLLAGDEAFVQDVEDLRHPLSQ